MSGYRSVVAVVLAVAGASAAGGDLPGFARHWMFVSETSAVIVWQLDDISQAATSRVEYGPTPALGSATRTAVWQPTMPWASMSSRSPGLPVRMGSVISGSISRGSMR